MAKDLFERASRVMPGGVSSPVRAFKSVGGEPRFLVRGDGAHVWDNEKRQYIDFQMAFGPLILGHAETSVVHAIEDAARLGTAFGAPHPFEVELAEKIVRAHPAAQWVRFVNSGTEATMSALRVARAATRRSLVVKFEGCYHGHADAFLVKAGSGLATLGLSSSAGVPAGVVADTAVLPLDDDAALEAFFAARGHEVAAVILELVPANNGLLVQRAEWVKRVERLAHAAGALLIADEVITGFRLGWGGASERYGVKPDLVTFGKIIGGGLPVGAYGGRADLKALVAPEGPVYQAGTLAGNPPALAAGLATFKVLENEVAPFPELAMRTTKLARGLADLARDRKFPATVVADASMLWILPQEGEPPRRPDQVSADAVKRFAALHRELLARGIYWPPSAYEVGFLSLAHGPRYFPPVLAAFDGAFQAARDAR
ncbi:MAG: glutamate-1-semialdehyde 2,1-aminomutase [Thermoplasmatota archaeon]